MTGAPAIFIGGLVAMGFMVAAAFYLRFWAKTRDSLFLIFAIAFGLMAVNASLVALLGGQREELSNIYLIRFTAFLLIIIAILSKNSRKRSK